MTASKARLDDAERTSDITPRSPMTPVVPIRA